MKKVLKILGILIAIFVLAIVGFMVWMNESQPTGEAGQQAEVLAQKMLEATNKKAWDTTYCVQWTFKDVHHFFWDRKRNFVEVKWENNKVLLHTKSVTGKAYTADKLLGEEEAKPLISKAWEYFCNDSFWLLAFTKTHDEGVERTYVKQDDGQDGLMVSYASGGVTPGDSYLWLLDENGLPTSYKMWVSIIPIQGLEVTWENWEKLPTGAMVATSHKLANGMDITITNLKASHEYKDMGYEGDVFEELNM